MQSNKTVSKSGFCCLCRSRCGATYEINRDTLIRAQPAPDHPTGKALCLKGKAAPEILYNPDRILYPMRRTNPKGAAEPGWVKVSWDEAMSDIASHLKQIKKKDGAESIGFAVTSPSGTPISDSIDWIERFIRIFGSPNTVYATEICNWHKDHAHKFTYGSGILYPDYRNADAIVLWGFNPSSVWLDQATQISEARAQGKKIICIDPRRAGYAQSTDHWLRVLPGTDGVLAMGLASYLISHKAYDASFLKRWSNACLLVREDNGQFLKECDIYSQIKSDRYVAQKSDGTLAYYDPNTRKFDCNAAELKIDSATVAETLVGLIPCRSAFSLYAQTCARYTPKLVKRLTGIPESAFTAAGDVLIAAETIAYYGWSGIGQHKNATQIDRAIALLMALKGCYDKIGGNIEFDKHPSNSVTYHDQFPKGQLAKALGNTERPLGPPSQGWVLARDIYTSILDGTPYQTKAMIMFGANIAVSHSDSDRAAEALKTLKFHVHCDSIETPTAKFADYLLPVNTQWEREALRIGFEVSQSAEELIQLRQAMVSPLGDSKSDTEIIFDLACRLGMHEDFFDGDIDKARSWQLEPTGVTIEELRANPEGIRKPLAYQPQKYCRKENGKLRGFSTSTGLVEVYSELLQKHGYDPLPEFGLSTSLDREFPLYLTTAKSGYYCHSQHRNIESLRQRFPEPTVSLHPDTADAEGLEARDWAYIKTEHAQIKMRVSLDENLHPSVAVASYGWWQENKKLGLPDYDPFSSDGANYNRLISSDCIDPISGSVAHRSTRCVITSANPNQRRKPAWAGFQAAIVKSVEHIATGVTRVEFSMSNMKTLPDYLPGQHITLRVAMHGHSLPVIRCYSLIGSAYDSRRKTYAIAVRLVLPPPGKTDVPNGIMSDYISHDLSPGDSAELKAPSGRFSPPIMTEDPIVLVAGGIGITPFMSYLESAVDKESKHRIHLVYANRNAAGHAFADRINELKTILPGFTVLNIYNEPSPEDIPQVHFDRTGFASVKDILLSEFQAPPQVYLCGPPPMMAAIEKGLVEVNHPVDRIHKEAFVSPASTKQLPPGPYTVTLARSGKILNWRRTSGSLLELAEAEGLSLASGCRSGQCESCKVKILSGTTIHRIEVGFNEENACLTCQAMPASNLTLDV